MPVRLQESPECVPDLGSVGWISPLDPVRGPVSQGQIRAWESLRHSKTAKCKTMEAHVVKIRAIASESEAEAIATKTERIQFYRAVGAGTRKRGAGAEQNHATCQQISREISHE